MGRSLPTHPGSCRGSGSTTLYPRWDGTMIRHEREPGQRDHVFSSKLYAIFDARSALVSSASMPETHTATQIGERTSSK